VKKSVLTFFAAFFVFCAAASAHTGQFFHEGLSSGFVHPFRGFDHLLAMIAVGLWAAQMGGRAIWIVPSTFVMTMLGGWILGIQGFTLPFHEQGIALSVLLLGFAVTFAFKPSQWVTTGIAAVFAIFHGAAHGAEMPINTNAVTYVCGFLLATLILQACGVLFAKTAFIQKTLIPSVGMIIAAFGLVFLLS
jgi:urease accessory protein